MTKEQKDVIRSILATEADRPIIIDILERAVLQEMLDDDEEQYRQLLKRLTRTTYGEMRAKGLIP